MEPLQFREIRELLDACRLTRFDPEPKGVEKGCWEYFEGKYRAHVVDVPFDVLYIFADATRESIKQARRIAFKPNETFVVYAPSTKNLATLKSEFEKSARGFWSAPEYLASFMSNELDAYRKSLQKLLPAYYVAPGVQPPSGTTHRYPNPLEIFLTDPRTIAEQEGVGSVAVVLAEAGHGKTYMCEWLVAKLAKSNYGVLPVFVSSSQWQRLRAEELSSLGTTIVSSFRELGTTIPWVDGQEDLFLKVALKAGLFRIVFDGFDEYVLRMPGEIAVADTLAAIATLASDTGTRVVVTSRTSFWDSEVPMSPDGQPIVDNASNTYVYRLKPFDVNLARSYFELRFPGDSKKISRAVDMFRELSVDDPSFAGRGFVLLLVADLVISDEELGSAEKPLIRLMRAHCERERKRQELPLTSQQQLGALKQFVFEVVQGAEPSTDLLAMAVQYIAPELREEDAKASVKKMVSHALIVGKNGRWTIRQTQVEVALLAMQLLEISDGNGHGLALLTSFSSRRLDPGFESDLAAMLTALCQWNKAPDQGTDAVRELISVFFRVSAGSADAIRHNVLRRLSTLIALRAIEELGPHPHRERTSMLASMFPNGAFHGIVFFGGLAKFDWCNFAFIDCVFDNVRWSNCQFDSTTIFKNCHLLGGSTQYCKGFADITWTGCYMDEPGSQFKDQEAVSSGKKAYSEEHLKKDIYLVLEKFSGKGGVGFRSLNVADLGKGKIAVSPHKDQITEFVRRQLLEEHHLSGGEGVGLNVKDTAKDPIRALFSNNAWTGDLATLVNDLKRRIGIN